MLPLGVVGLLVIVPLTREYADLRRTCGLGRLGALAGSLALLPALALGLAVALRVADAPVLQWAAAVVVTVAAYSAATARLRRPAATPATRRSV